MASNHLSDKWILGEARKHGHTKESYIEPLWRNDEWLSRFKSDHKTFDFNDKDRLMSLDDFTDKYLKLVVA